MRSKAEIIGKLHRDRRSGVRDQKRNHLGEAARNYFGCGGLTTGTGAPENCLSDTGSRLFVSPLQQFNHKLHVVAVLQRLVPLVSDCSLLAVGQRVSLELVGQEGAGSAAQHQLGLERLDSHFLDCGFHWPYSALRFRSSSANCETFHTFNA